MEGVTPLFAAAFSGRFEVARFLVQAMQRRHGKWWQWEWPCFVLKRFASPFWPSATGRRWSELPTKPQFLPPKSLVQWELTLWDFTFRARFISNSLRPLSHEKKKSQYVAANNTQFSCLAGGWPFEIPHKKHQPWESQVSMQQCQHVHKSNHAWCCCSYASRVPGCLGWGDCIFFTSASQPAKSTRLCRHRLRPDVGALLGGTQREANWGFEISDDWDC